MKLTTTLPALFVFVTSALAATTVTVSFDDSYDKETGSLSTVACSDGSNGLLKRFPTFKDLPTYPNIGGAEAIAGFNSPNCGTCWALTFNGTTINVLAIDHTLTGFNIAEAAINTLTDDQASLGKINAESTQVAASVCGL
ncbi:Cerato-platanin [Hysterangium stoloniferum]|nr:Cerato-platanin [Hysterangium stoloniferum]